jgi:hypothetical protein
MTRWIFNRSANLWKAFGIRALRSSPVHTDDIEGERCKLLLISTLRWKILPGMSQIPCRHGTDLAGRTEDPQKFPHRLRGFRDSFGVKTGSEIDVWSPL